WALQDWQEAATREYQQQLADWNALQAGVGEAFAEVRRIATKEMNKLKEAAGSTNDALGAMRDRVGAQTSLLDRFIRGLDGIYNSISSVFDLIEEQVRDLRGQAGAGGMYAAQ